MAKTDSHDDDKTIEQGVGAMAPTVSIDATVVPGVTAGTSYNVDVEYGVTPQCEGRYDSPGDIGAAEIGRGGMGRILALFDRHVGREVALKEIQPEALIPPGGVDSEDYSSTKIARFLREARVTGQLIHPNIVPVYEVGIKADGTLYYTMRLVHGKTFGQALKECDGIDERLKLLSHFCDLCNAIAYAHSQGVIHRDIKPDNVMLGEFGETLVLDWGLAKIVGEEEVDGADDSLGDQGSYSQSGISMSGSSSLTVDGSFMGTPSYVSPEQASGNLLEMGTHMDIWSLGAMLYEILTGRPPFQGDTAHEVLVRVLTDEVVSPSDVLDEVPPDLASVCVKALARDRERRYSNAKELADEIEAFRSGRRVLAHEYSPWEHFKRFAAQKKGLLAASLAVLIVIIAALAIIAKSYADEKTAKEEAQAATSSEHAARFEERMERMKSSYYYAQGAAEKASRLASQRRSLSSSVYAASAILQNPIVEKSPVHDPKFVKAFPDGRELMLRSYSQLLQTTSDSFVKLRYSYKGDGPSNKVVLSGDGTRIAEAYRDGHVRVVDASTLSERFSINVFDGEVTAIVFNPSGTEIATSGDDGVIRRWRAADGEIILSAEGHEGRVLDLAWSPDGRFLASCGKDDVVRIWNAGDLSLVHSLEGHGGSVLSIAYSDDGTYLVSGSRDHTARIWDTGTGALKTVLEGHTAVVSGVAISPQGDLIATGSYDKTARVWNAETGKTIWTAKHKDELMSVDFSSDGTFLLTGCWDRALKLWSAANGALMTTVDAHENPVLLAEFSKDDRTIISNDGLGNIRLWSKTTPLPVLVEPDQGYLWDAAYSPDGKFVATAGQDGTIRLWDAEKGTLVRRLVGHSDYVQRIDFSNDGVFLASGGYDRNVRIWRVDTGEIVHELEGHEDIVRSVDFSTDGTRLASSGRDGLVLLWSASSGELIARAEDHRGQARCAVFSPDDKWLISGGDDGIVRLRDPNDCSVKRILETNGDKVMDVAFSPKSDRIVVLTYSGKLYIWNLETGNSPVLSRGDTILHRVQFTSDGSLFLVSGDDATVAIWSVQKLTPILLLSAGQTVTAADFSPDDKMVVMGDSNSARIYPLDMELFEALPADLLKKAERALGADLDGFNLVPPKRDIRP